MDTNNRPSTSYVKSDSSDEDDEHYENLSTEELSLKMKTFRNLCFNNKINVTNAFNIDMIACFNSWLKKKKSSNSEENYDSTTFQEMSDYLEASKKVYAYRVDNLTETTSKLVEQFKSNKPNNSTTKIDVDNNATTIQKFKRRRTMLTTPDKLRRTSNENENTFNLAQINHTIPSLNYNELFSSGRPSRYFTSLFFNKSLAEELKTSNENNDKKEQNDQTIEVDKSFLELGDLMRTGSICPEFHCFVADRDKVDSSNDDQLTGIEYHFDPTNHQFLNNSDDSVCNEPENNKLDSCSNDDKNTTVLDGLLACIDNVDREYSYFNPKLLANWKGPKAWKAQAMAKALKSCTSSERKDIISNINDSIDESTQQNIKQTKTYKNRNQVKKNTVKIDWLDMSQLDEILKKYDHEKNMISLHTLKKWNPLDNVSDPHSIVFDVVYKFDLLKYIEIKPDWWICYKNLEKDSGSETSSSNQNSNDYSQTIVDTSEAMEIDYEVFEKSEIKNDDNLANLNASRELNPEDENVVANIKTESRMDVEIEGLKKEISDIIDEQCVETDPNSDWSSKLSFFNLITMLRANERDGLSIPIVFVGLLHLANERGLKLFQEHCVINDMEETFIAKPMNKE